MRSADSLSCLIGYSGFVGGNLFSGRRFTDLYRSVNIRDIEGREYDLVVCAGVTAAKYIANRDPEKDLADIETLLSSLEKVVADRFVLVSTIDVFPNPSGVDEDTEPDRKNHPYGQHRLLVEDCVRGAFPNHLIVRLSGLFGPGLKKNIIFDLIHDNNLERIHPDGTYQYYSVARLAGDIDRATDAGLELLHVATEPVRTAEIVDAFFPGKTIGAAASLPASYDFRSRHAALWGKSGPYLYDKKEIMTDLGAFLRRTEV